MNKLNPYKNIEDHDLIGFYNFYGFKGQMIKDIQDELMHALTLETEYLLKDSNLGRLSEAQWFLINANLATIHAPSKKLCLTIFGRGIVCLNMMETTESIEAKNWAFAAISSYYQNDFFINSYIARKYFSALVVNIETLALLLEEVPQNEEVTINGTLQEITDQSKAIIKYMSV